MIKQDSNIKVLIITGNGDKTFVSGSDIREMMNMRPLDRHICFDASDTKEGLTAFVEKRKQLFKGGQTPFLEEQNSTLSRIYGWIEG